MTLFRIRDIRSLYAHGNRTVRAKTRVEMSFSRRSLERIAEALAVVGVVALHIVYFLLCLRKGHIDPGVDGEVYRQLARDYLNSPTLLGENCKIVFWTPWYLFIAAVGATQGGVFLLQLSVFTISLVAVLNVAKKLGMNRYWPTLAVLSYGLYWPTFDYVVFYQYENFLAWGVITTLCLLGANRARLERETWRWLAAGIVVGLTVLAHSRVAGLAVLCGIIFVSVCLRTRRFLWLPAVAFMVPLLLPTFLWGVRNRLLWGQWIFSSTSFGYNLYVGFNPVATGSFMPQPPYPPLDQAAQMAWDFIRSHPSRALELILWKLIRYWEISEPSQFGPSLFLWQERVLMPLGLVGYAIGLWRTLRRLWTLRLNLFEETSSTILFSTVFMITYFQIFHAIFYVFTPRFRIPAMPIISLLGIWVLWEAWTNCSEKRGTKCLKSADTP